MPEPYKGNRGVAQNYIPTLIEEGLGNTAIADFLRLNDLGYRTQNMLQDINRLRLEFFGALSLPTLDASAQVPERFMRQWTGDTTYKYRVVIKYDYFNQDTLQMERTGTTLYFNEAPSQDDVFDAWGIRKQTIENFYKYNIEGASQFMYYKNVGAH